MIITGNKYNVKESVLVTHGKFGRFVSKYRLNIKFKKSVPGWTGISLDTPPQHIQEQEARGRGPGRLLQSETLAQLRKLQTEGWGLQYEGIQEVQPRQMHSLFIP